MMLIDQLLDAWKKALADNAAAHARVQSAVRALKAEIDLMSAQSDAPAGLNLEVRSVGKTVKCANPKRKGAQPVRGDVAINPGDTLLLELLDGNGQPLTQQPDASKVATTLVPSDTTVMTVVQDPGNVLKYDATLLKAGAVTLHGDLTYNDGSFGPFSADTQTITVPQPPSGPPAKLVILLGGQPA